jgi:acylphosphatase
MRKSEAYKAFSAKIEGRVQGVGFRYYTKCEAEKYNVVGWVRNNDDDGSVELWAEGYESTLQQFLDWLEHGPPNARIINTQSNWQIPTKSYKGFTVTY